MNVDKLYIIFVISFLLEMERSVIWFTFLILWLAVAQANIEEACEQQVKCLCIERYVQAQYCEADFGNLIIIQNFFDNFSYYKY